MRFNIDRRLLAIAATFLVSMFPTPALADFEPNSDVFVIQDYFYPNGRGDQIPYRSAVVVQQPTVERRGEIRVLPNIYVLGNDVKFISSEGVEYAFEGGSVAPASITITPSIDVTPSRDLIASKIAGVMGLSDDSLQRYPLVVPYLGSSSIPQMHRPVTDLNEAFVSAIVDASSPYISNRWQADPSVLNRFDFNTSQVRQLKITLLVDGVVEASRTLNGTAILSGGSLPALTIRDPDLYTANRIKSGGYEIEATFEIADSRISSITATIDYQAVITSFIEQTRRVSTRSRSSGWKILGFGSRTRRLKTSIDEALRSENNIDTVNNTTITMVDPTDDMVRRFEADFFPSVSRAEAVAAHQAAAARAASEGKPDLAKVHSDYATALISNEPSLETDAMAAAAALASQNYIGFIAAGVRMSNEDSRRTDNFRRVVNSTTTIATSRGWNETRVISGNRQIAMAVIPESGLVESAYIGICGVLPVIGFTENDPALMITCVDKAGPLHRSSARLIPGMIIFSVNGEKVTSLEEFRAAKVNNNPGDLIEIGVISQRGFLPQFSRQIVEVRLASRWQ